MITRKGLVIGIDPGDKGAIAIWDGVQITTIKMPDSYKGIVELIRNIGPERCILEDVGQHIQGNNASSSVKLAKHVGVLQGTLLALGIEMIKVRPRKWMDKCVPDRPKGLDKVGARKTYITQWCQSLLPDMKIHKYESDAIAILISMEELYDDIKSNG